MQGVARCIITQGLFGGLFLGAADAAGWDAQMNMLTQPPKVFGNDSDHGSNRDSIVWFDQAPDLNSL